jgi:membrane-bound inhibitor of C-type lysozyme
MQFSVSGTALASGQFVVAAGNTSTFKVSGLQPGTTYHIAVFEYDGDASHSRYLTTTFAKGATGTLVAPTQQASELSVSDVLTTSATIKFKRGNGENTLIVMKEGSPVDVTPADLVAYTQSTNFGGGAQIGSGNYVVSFGTATTISVGMLATNKTYYVKAFEANGRFFPVYNTTGAPQASFSTSAKPSQPASQLNFSYIEGNSMRIGWNSGNGTRRVIIAREGAAVTATPQDAVVYTANAAFGSGTQVAPGQYVIYNDNGGSMYLNALQPNKTYHVAVFEYSLDGSAPYYLTAQFAAGSKASLSAPTEAASNLTYANITSHSITLNWTPGNGHRRILIARANAPVSATLTDLKGYTSGTTIGTGSHLGNGNYVITSGDISSATAYGLQRGVRYYFKVVEYNGLTGPVYLHSTALTGDAMTADRPTEASVNPQVENVEGNSLRFKWTRGNGERRVVFAKEGSPVTAVPVDGQVYTANAIFGSGQKLATGEYVVADLNLSSFDLKGLKAGTTYHIRVFEYEDLGANTAYIHANSLTYSAQTLVAPTVQAANLNGAGTTATTTNLGWTNGNGQRRIIIARAHEPVNVVPTDYVTYAGYAAFGTGSDLGNGNFVIYSGTESSAPVTNLQTGVTYYFAAFEYNGNTGPCVSENVCCHRQYNHYRPTNTIGKGSLLHQPLGHWLGATQLDQRQRSPAAGDYEAGKPG